jgi:hypothetical protein
MMNLTGFPAAVERYKNQGSGNFAHEDPLTTNYEQLAPTSGRKLWKLNHGKKIKKPLKADRKGYKGNN